MASHRFLPHLAVASMLVALAGCGGVTAFQGGPIAIAGNPPAPPPPPPPPPPKEEPKPPPRVELKDNKIEFKEKIQFEVNKAIIKEASFGLLKDIAKVIKDNPHVKKISIEGHASAEGNAAANKKLSDDRAKSVMDHLVKTEAVDPKRLTAKGWGSEKGIASNDNEEGREKNRRVEFLVVEQDVTQKKVEIDPATGKERIVEEKKETMTHPDHAATPGTPATPATPGKAVPTKPANPATPAKPATPAPATSAKPAAPATSATPPAGVKKP